MLREVSSVVEDFTTDLQATENSKTVDWPAARGLHFRSNNPAGSCHCAAVTSRAEAFSWIASLAGAAESERSGGSFATFSAERVKESAKASDRGRATGLDRDEAARRSVHDSKGGA